MSKKSKMGVTKWAKWVSGTLLCKFTQVHKFIYCFSFFTFYAQQRAILVPFLVGR